MSNWAKIIIGDSRNMGEIDSNSVALVVTSPPYWHIKDYQVKGQIGYGQSLHEYLRSLYCVWQECFRVLKPSRRLCINIGDQFARSTVYGRYKIIPLHSEIISQCETIGFDYMGSIIWQKKTTMNTTGGANIMGSYPYPPNGMIEIDYEYILIFKKPGKPEKISREIKDLSKLSKEEWKSYFYGHWNFAGAKQTEHEAMFPEELPKRLIKMFSFVNETILDPFLGSGTTAKVALNLRRNAIGYEINKEFLNTIQKKINSYDLFNNNKIKITTKKTSTECKPESYAPSIKDAQPKKTDEIDTKKEKTYKVVEIIDEQTIKIDNGLVVKLKGVEVIKKEDAVKYLKEYILKKEVLIKHDSKTPDSDGQIKAYVYLENGIFVNAYLIKSGMAKAEKKENYDKKEKFIKLEKAV